MSQLLREFLSAWIEWVDAGAPSGEPFARRYGLCSNLDDWMFSTDLAGDVRGRTARELTALFVADGLSKDYPFGGFDEYWDDQDENLMHLNPARIQWVRSKVAQHEVV